MWPALAPAQRLSVPCRRGAGHTSPLLRALRGGVVPGAFLRRPAGLLRRVHRDGGRQDRQGGRRGVERLHGPARAAGDRGVGLVSLAEQPVDGLAQVVGGGETMETTIRRALDHVWYDGI